MSLEDTTNAGRKTPNELREMSRQEAEMWLDGEEFKRWERLKALDEQRAETKAEWAKEERRTVDTLVKADMGSLTTGLELYGNEVSVLVNLDRKQRDLMRSIQQKYDGVEDVDNLSESEIDTLESMLADWLGVVIREFNGTRLPDLSQEERQELTLSMVEAWGLRATIMAMVDIVESINEQDAEVMDAVESFRGETG